MVLASGAARRTLDGNLFLRDELFRPFGSKSAAPLEFHTAEIEESPLLPSVVGVFLSSFGVRVVSSVAPLSISNDAIKSDGLITGVVDWVFGYDFFLSYSHGDGMRLPRRLKERLEQAGFRVFLDQ